MKRLNQSGSHVVVLVLGLLVIGVVAFGGYRVTHTTDSSDTSAPLTAKTATPATISDKADLTATAKSLDDSSADLNSSVNGDSLNTDLNALL